jgi:15-cis-phytoene synthase
MTTWSHTEWVRQDAEVRARALGRTPGSDEERRALVRFGRTVLRQFSTSFFIVTRFLPPLKRAQVDMIYAAVRYPDEIVDTLPFDVPTRRRLLARWRADYDAALEAGSIREAMLQGLPVILAGMAQVTRETGLPPQYYHSFLDAMEADIEPRAYATLDDLIENYIYGSATVVGYFLVYVYGSTTPRDFQRAMYAARELAIALQLTNFLRDVNEDQSRGRLYLPADMLAQHGFQGDFRSPTGRDALENTVRDLARYADRAYAQAKANLDAFAPDCRMAIDSCIRVYGELNRRVANGTTVLERRESVPLRRKLSVLPSSKYWRLPLAWMGLEPA